MFDFSQQATMSEARSSNDFIGTDYLLDRLINYNGVLFSAAVTTVPARALVIDKTADMNEIEIVQHKHDLLSKFNTLINVRPTKGGLNLAVTQNGHIVCTGKSLDSLALAVLKKLGSDYDCLDKTAASKGPVAEAKHMRRQGLCVSAC